MTPSYILVSPQLPENVGAVARAMANFGLCDLRLVTPQPAILNENAFALAAGADHILENAQVFDRFEDAIADLNWIYGTCATQRHLIKDFVSPRAAIENLNPLEKGERMGILFGPERTGLSNDLLARCQAILQIPVQETFSSLNLAQAVAIISYEWFQAQHPERAKQHTFVTGETVMASQGQISAFLAELETLLDESSFWRILHKKPIMWRNTQNIFARMSLTAQDVRTLWGITRSLFRYQSPQSPQSPHREGKIG